ncbi:MAG: hypothetical protein WBA41_01720 [Rivularia sp. (in: cyanobacteria)]
MLPALDRTSLVILLLEKLTQKYGSRRLNIHFNCECTQVNFTGKTVKLNFLVTEEDFTHNYDLLIRLDK